MPTIIASSLPGYLRDNVENSDRGGRDFVNVLLLGLYIKCPGVSVFPGSLPPTAVKALLVAGGHSCLYPYDSLVHACVVYRWSTSVVHHA